MHSAHTEMPRLFPNKNCIYKLTLPLVSPHHAMQNVVWDFYNKTLRLTPILINMFHSQDSATVANFIRGT